MRVSCYLVWLKKKIKMHQVKKEWVWKITFAAVFCVGVSSIVKAKGNATVLLLAKRDRVPK